MTEVDRLALIVSELLELSRAGEEPAARGDGEHRGRRSSARPVAGAGRRATRGAASA